MLKLGLSLIAGIIALTLMGQNDLLIRDIAILPMSSDTLLVHKSVLIQNGQIVEIGDSQMVQTPKNCKVIDGAGKFLMPGLAEMHSHLPVEKKVDTFLMTNVAAGVTHLRIMNTKSSQMALKKRIENNADFITPKLHYSYIIKKDVNFIEPQFDSALIAAKRDGYNFVKLLSIYNQTVFENLMRAAKRQNMIVCGHYPESVFLGRLFQFEFRSIEHLGGYENFPDTNYLALAVQQTKAAGIFNCPTLEWDKMAFFLTYPNNAYKNRLVFKIAPAKYLQRWERDFRAEAKAVGEASLMGQINQYLPIFKRKQWLLKKMYDNQCLLLLGSDPSSFFQMDGFNMYEEMRNWSELGIDNYTILKSATLVPAMFFKEDAQWGSVEVGKSADLLILTKNPRLDVDNMMSLETTIIGGKLFSKAEILKKL